MKLILTLKYVRKTKSGFGYRRDFPPDVRGGIGAVTFTKPLGRTESEAARQWPSANAEYDRVVAVEKRKLSGQLSKREIYQLGIERLRAMGFEPNPDDSQPLSDEELHEDEARRVAADEIVAAYFKHMGLEASGALSSFLLYTGCRLGEALSLTRDRVQDNRATFHYSVTKTSKTRQVPLVGPARVAWNIICRLSKDDRPFSRVSRNTYRGHWMRFKVHMGLWEDDEFVPHMLRHTCASRLVAKGVPLTKVMLWMGHASMQTTLRYSHLAPEDLVAAAELLWPD